MASSLKVENFRISLRKFSKQDFRNNNKKTSTKLNLGSKCVNCIDYKNHLPGCGTGSARELA